ncbi:MAG TPA: sugar ABC transporter permease [Isosphaeraceae bacterium]|nr:sugar ABC transporter permease [Isosphaeraceae bacterium]
MMQTTNGRAVSGDSGIAAVAPASRARRRLSWLRGDRALAVLVLSPSIIAVAVFIYSFILWSFYISTVKWNDFVPNYTFVGLENWITIFSDSRFLTDLRNLVLYAAGFMSQCIILGFILAVLIDQKITGESIFRTIFIFPFAVSGIVTGVAWRWLMRPEAGLNLLFHSVGLDFLRSPWYTDPNTGILAVSVAGAWQFSGYVMALYLAALRGISNDLREAAAIDGCNTFNLYRYVIVPLLTPTTFTAIVLTGMGSIRVFDIPAVIGTGAAFGADAMANYMFTLTFTSLKYALGATIASVMILLSAFLVVPYLLSMRREAEQ